MKTRRRWGAGIPLLLRPLFVHSQAEIAHAVARAVLDPPSPRGALPLLILTETTADAPPLRSR